MGLQRKVFGQWVAYARGRAEGREEGRAEERATNLMHICRVIIKKRVSTPLRFGPYSPSSYHIRIMC